MRDSSESGAIDRPTTPREEEREHDELSAMAFEAEHCGEFDKEPPKECRSGSVACVAAPASRPRHAGSPVDELGVSQVACPTLQLTRQEDPRDDPRSYP